MASGLLPKSPVSSSLCDEVPHIFIPKSHLEPREFLISSAKRLLQQYRHIADNRGTATICPLLDKSGQRLILARDCLSANDPKRTCGQYTDWLETAINGWRQDHDCRIPESQAVMPIMRRFATAAVLIFGVASGHAGSLNIVVVGASNTAGWCVGAENAFPARLQTILKERDIDSMVTTGHQ